MSATRALFVLVVLLGASACEEPCLAACQSAIHAAGHVDAGLDVPLAIDLCHGGTCASATLVGGLCDGVELSCTSSAEVSGGSSVDVYLYLAPPSALDPAAPVMVRVSRADTAQVLVDAALTLAISSDGEICGKTCELGRVTWGAPP